MVRNEVGWEMGERRMGEEVVTVFREGENRDLGEELRGVNDVDM
jgi:hypothetical protein